MKRFLSLLCALALIVGCMGDLTLIANAADAGGASREASGSVTYYVSISGKGGNNGRSETSPFPGLDAVPWDQLLPGDSVLLKKGDTFPGAIRLVDVHGTADKPITIGAYGTGSAAPVIEARGQGIWLPETGNSGSDGTPGKYASAGVLLYDCSYITVSGLEIVNVPAALKTSFQDRAGASDALGVSDHSSIKLPCAGVAVAADDVGPAEGITLSGITVRGDSDVRTVMTDTSTSISTTGVTKGAMASPRAFTDASGTYYVSSLNGSDANDGSSPDKAFYSLHKINGLNLKPGAKVYLEYGSVFENQYLHIEGGGSAAQPVIIDAYGNTGDPKPLINTNGNGVWYQNFRQNLDNENHLRQGYVSSSILIYDVEYLEVKNIAMTNFGRYGETPGADFANLGSYDGGTVPGETGYNGTGQNNEGNKIGCYQWGGKMARTGVAGVSQNVGTMDHVYLQNLDIENVYGNVAYKHMDNGGIYFTIAYALDEAATGIPKIDDLRIEGCYLKRVSRWGIAAAYTGAYSGLFGTAAISDETCQKYGVTNLYIGHNYLEEVGGDPITTMYAYEPLIEYNVALNGGREMSNSSTARYMNNYPFRGNRGDVSAGIWPWKCKTALFEHNECYTMMYGDFGGNGDCQAWDADYGDSTIYQYNYSAGNTGGCVMFCYGQAYNTVFRYNISYKDGVSSKGGNNQGVLDIVNSANGQISNNTFIMAQGTPANRPGHSGPAHIENNIFYNLGSAYNPNWNQNASLTYNNNLYVGFTANPSDDSSPSTAEKGALFADTTFAGAPEEPLGTSKAGVRTVNGIRDWTHDWESAFDMFQLKDAPNAAVNAGVPHNYTGLTQDSNFGVPRVDNNKDFYGNALDDVHDMGAHDTLTAGGELPAESGNELIASLYELRNTTELQVPFTASNPMTVADFVKGLTVSDGAAVEVYSGTTKQADTDNIAADMTVKIVAGDGTANDTAYTIKNKNSYNHKTDFVGNQQGNVWFHQYRLKSTGDLVNLPNFAGGDTGYWTGSNNTCSEYIGAADDDTASRTYNGTGFVFRAPATGKVTISFPEMPKFRYSTASGNSFDTSLIIYVNGRPVDGKAYQVPKPASGTATPTAVSIENFDLTVGQGDTIEFMVVNSGTFTSAHVANCADVTFNVAVTYKDEEVTEPPADTKAPTAPGSVWAANVTDNSATIGWTASTDNVGVVGYNVSVDNGTPETVTDLTDLTKNLSGLNDDTDHTVTVTAVDAAGNESAESSVTFRTAKAPDNDNPTAPTSGRAVSVTQTTATIEWAGATDYVGVDSYKVTVNGETVTVRNGEQVTLTGLTAGTDYTVTVIAVDAAGNESGAFSITFRTLAADDTKPAAPTGLAAVDITRTTALLRWNPSASEDVVGYQLLQIGSETPLDLGNVLQYALADLSASAQYTVKVRAIDESGNNSDWTDADFTTAAGSSACELISTLFEISGSVLQIPYTDLNPLTLEEFRAAFTVSEDATVKVYNGDTEVTTGNVTAGMTVKIVAQNGRENPTTYTTALKPTYNSFEDWGTGDQGNVWFYQHENGTGIVNHTHKESWGWGGESPDYKSVEKNQACGSVTAAQGSGFTFRAPADGKVKVQFFCYSGKNSNDHTEDTVQKRENTTSGNTLTHYIRVFMNGSDLESRVIPLGKTNAAVHVEPMTFSVKQGDTLSFLARNEGDFSAKGGNNGVLFNPVVTYLDETYVPDASSITITPASATIYTNPSTDWPSTVQLSAAVLPAGANQTVTWSVRESDRNYVSVSSTGLVTALSKADRPAVVYATTTNSSGQTIQGACRVTVRTRIESIAVTRDDGSSEPIKIYVNKNDHDHPNSIALTAVRNPANPSHPSLNWNKISGDNIIRIDRNGQNGTSATIAANGDETDVGRVTVRVASADHPDTNTTFDVDVFRFLENDIRITGSAKVGSTLTASTENLAITSEAERALQYQWYRDSISNGTKITGATDKQYAVTSADAGHKLFVTVTADPATFYEGTRTASTPGTVVLADSPAAPTGLGKVDCTVGSNGQITGLDASMVYEYKLVTEGDDDWNEVSNATIIDNLPAGDYQVRIAATDTTAASAPATVTILPAGATGYHNITVASGIEHGSIVPSATQAQKDTKFTLTVMPDTGYELRSLSVTYTDENGDEQPLTAGQDGKYTMPDADVTVRATFAILTFTINHDMNNVTCTLDGEHTHTVDYGATPDITFTADEGYTMPTRVDVLGDDDQPFPGGYIYSRSASKPDTATLRFIDGIDRNLTISAVIPKKTFTVNFELSDGLDAPEAGNTNAPTVRFKEQYVGRLEAEDPSEYTLPLGIQITMNGEPFTDFSYNNETGQFIIGAGKITGDLVITASGLDAAIEVNPVVDLKLTPSSASVVVNGTVTLTATVIGADPDVDATYPTVVWTTGDSEIATVDENGVVTGVAEGTVTIKATTVDGGISRTCQVTVNKAGGSNVPSGGGIGGILTPPTTTTVVENPDGSTTTTVTDNRTGTVTETTDKPDGSSETVETKKDGTITSTATDPEGGKVEKVVTPDEAVTITVTNPEGETLAKVEIPAEIPGPSEKFVDVPEGHWAEDAINQAAGLGLVEGVGDNQFNWNGNMVRGDLAVVLHRLSSKVSTDNDVAFDDVPAGAYYAESVAWAAATGVVKGYSDTEFGPKDNITREELAVMLYRYAKLLKLDTAASADALDAFNDGSSVNDWAEDGMAWCVENEIIKGKGNDTLDPGAYASRAEVTVMLQRFVNLINGK